MTWREDDPYGAQDDTTPTQQPQVIQASEGMSIRLAAIPGLTAPGLLSAPFFFQLPPLESFELQLAYTHNDYDTVDAGQFSRRGGRQLRTLSFDTLTVDPDMLAMQSNIFPESPPPPPFLSGRRLPIRPDVVGGAHQDLEDILNSGKPFKFTATVASDNQLTAQGASGAGVWVSMAATLRNLAITERAGEPDARYFTCEFHEYRDPRVNNRRRGGKKLPATLILRPDGTALDAYGNVIGSPAHPVTLASLATLFYGEPNAAFGIGADNKIPDWGTHTPIVDSTRYRNGGKLIIAQLGAVVAA